MNRCGWKHAPVAAAMETKHERGNLENASWACFDQYYYVERPHMSVGGEITLSMYNLAVNVNNRLVNDSIYIDKIFSNGRTIVCTH